MKTIGLLLLGTTWAHAQLAVTVSPPKAAGNKAVVKLELKNKFAEKVESARAVCFLLDEQGKVVGQATQWVIGGTKDKPSLAPDATATYNFVIPTDKSFTTTKVSFSRVILEGGKRADVAREVSITVEKN